MTTESTTGCCSGDATATGVASSTRRRRRFGMTREAVPQFVGGESGTGVTHRRRVRRRLRRRTALRTARQLLQREATDPRRPSAATAGAGVVLRQRTA